MHTAPFCWQWYRKMIERKLLKHEHAVMHQGCIDWSVLELWQDESAYKRGHVSALWEAWRLPDNEATGCILKVTLRTTQAASKFNSNFWTLRFQSCLTKAQVRKVQHSLPAESPEIKINKNKKEKNSNILDDWLVNKHTLHNYTMSRTELFYTIKASTLQKISFFFFFLHSTGPYQAKALCLLANDSLQENNNALHITSFPRYTRATNDASKFRQRNGDRHYHLSSLLQPCIQHT